MADVETEKTEETPRTPEQALLENLRLMNQITREMREIPELPSEVPKDTHPLIKVEFPPAGGIHTYMEGYEYPYKGYPIGEFVEKIDLLKKVVRNGLSGMYHRVKRRKLKWMLILVPWIALDAAAGMLYTLYRIVDRFKIKRERYSDAVRELHRACSLEFFGEATSEREMRLMVRDVTCMVLEFDNAYRFRFQDIVMELDKEALAKNARKELTRLLSLMQTREQTQEINDTWKLLKYFLPVLLLKRAVRKNIAAVLGSLDLDKMRLSVEDECFCKDRKDYKFGFMYGNN